MPLTMSVFQSLELEVLPGGRYRLFFEAAPGLGELRVFGAAWNQPIDDSRPLARGSQSPLSFPSPSPGRRHHFKVQSASGASVHLCERRLPLEGSRNFRDLGGYLNRHGRRVRWGQVFRSGELARLNPQDLAQLQQLGLEVVCDFRHEAEQRRHPSRLPSDVKVLNLAIAPGNSLFVLDKIQRSGSTSVAEVEAMMCEINRELVHRYAQQYRTLLKRLDRAGGVLFHCSAGKDRTGFGAALILMALEVPRELIFEDYLLSNRYIDLDADLERIRANYRIDRSFKDQHLQPMLQVKREYLETAFEEIDRNYSSELEYLEQSIGIDSKLRERLQSRLLEEPD